MAGSPLGSALEEMSEEVDVRLRPLLERVNGFYAFESALHVLPSGSTPERAVSLTSWNERNFWRNSFSGLADGLLFFAEDIFGGQFAFRGEKIVAFDPETGDVQPLANDLEDWAEQVMVRYRVLTGYPLAHQWQEQNGPLPAGHRLLPKTPFVLGGKFVVCNLYPLEAVKGMRLRGELAVQIRDLPDGAQVQFNIVD